jgi:hypothetical protein
VFIIIEKKQIIRFIVFFSVYFVLNLIVYVFAKKIMILETALIYIPSLCLMTLFSDIKINKNMLYGLLLLEIVLVFMLIVFK